MKYSACLLYSDSEPTLGGKEELQRRFLMFLGETKRLIREVLAQVVLSRESVMAEIDRLRQAITDELGQLRTNLTAETDQLRTELEEALDRAEASDEAKEEALAALEDYRSRITGLTDEVSTEGIFGEADVEEPNDEEVPEPSVLPPIHPELPTEEEENPDEDEGFGDSRGFFTR